MERFKHLTFNFSFRNGSRCIRIRRADGVWVLQTEIQRFRTEPEAAFVQTLFLFTVHTHKSHQGPRIILRLLLEKNRTGGFGPGIFAHVHAGTLFGQELFPVEYRHKTSG